MGVDDVTDEEEYNKVEDMTTFAVEVDTTILLAQEEAPYARHDHNEGTIVKRPIINIPLVEWLSLVIFLINIYYLYSSFEIFVILFCLTQSVEE